MSNIIAWLEATAEASPKAIAFSDVSASVTYEELLSASQTAGSGIAAQTSERTAIAFFLEKSVSAICGMMGAVQARCFYCVLDVRQPKTRLKSIIGALKPALIVTDAAQAQTCEQSLGDCGIPIIRLEDLLASPQNKKELAIRRAHALDTDPLYVNFTSGSTGTPKGVVISHRSVLDFIPHFTTIFNITADDRIANQAPFDFDVSVKDIYSALYTGAQVHLIPREYFSIPVKLMDFLVNRRITVCIWAVSAMCFVSVMHAFDYRVPHTIRRVIFSGEVMPIKQLNVWRTHLPDAVFANVYGPTEITCNCTYYIIDRNFDVDEVVPIGKPFPNEHVFLLDDDNAEVTQIDASGEICVAGSALALGYLNEAARTADTFVQNPLNASWMETIYRTGDIGKWDESGNLVYVTRKDFQIKHMGQRIELGEIDATAQAIEGIDRACTIYHEERKRILLFYVGELAASELAGQLAERLPSYMVPGKIEKVVAMPLTKNGKIDRVELLHAGGLR